MTDGSTMDGAQGGPTRRGALARVGLWGGLVAAYGTLATFFARFLYPARPARRGWLYVAEVARLPAGGSLVFRMPDGARINVAHKGAGDGADDFVALSSTCPHLGCQVHWQAQESRFFCPCHNGVFDPDGKATAGPPAEAGQSLTRVPLKVEGGLVYVEAPLVDVARGEGEIVQPDEPSGPGHDACLSACARDARGGVA